jgi:NADH-quinone oxidoreductase subunit C
MAEETTATKDAAAEYPGIAKRIHEELPGIPFAASRTNTDVNLTVEAEHLTELVRGLKSKPNLAFDMLVNVAGVDFEAAGMAVKYHLYSFTHRHLVQITVPTAPGRPHVPSLTGIYTAADWHEREAAEMFGFIFDGHPELKNLLLDDDLVIFPLLKAHPLAPVEIKQGIEDDSPGYEF